MPFIKETVVAKVCLAMWNFRFLVISHCLAICFRQTSEDFNEATGKTFPGFSGKFR